MNLSNLLPLAEIDTSFAERHERTGSFLQEGYWFPEQASEFAPHTDFLFMAISWISAIFFALRQKYTKQADSKPESLSGGSMPG